MSLVWTVNEYLLLVSTISNMRSLINCTVHIPDGIGFLVEEDVKTLNILYNSSVLVAWYDSC